MGLAEFSILSHLSIFSSPLFAHSPQSNLDLTISDDPSPYGYTLAKSICILFVVLFTISTLAAGLFDIVGWFARLYSSTDANALAPYIIQTTSTILALTPLSATSFTILRRLIRRLEFEYSLIGLFTNLFLFEVQSFSCPVFVALTVRSVGGAMASITASNDKDADRYAYPSPSSQQIPLFSPPCPPSLLRSSHLNGRQVTIIAYVALATEFICVHARQAKGHRAQHQAPARRPVLHDDLPLHPIRPLPSHPPKCFLTILIDLLHPSSLVDSSIVSKYTSVYRTIELANDFQGRIITTQVYFKALDGAMVILAIYTSTSCTRASSSPTSLASSPTVTSVGPFPARCSPWIHIAHEGEASRVTGLLSVLARFAVRLTGHHES
ncbi:hypothetical protein EW146_g289 [Bondarzewia mesenterica]|uniref:Uncharacterized protein n=1 Tax=Bondarzewia mesenterica TaxID=1095465 RepID=A0A4S4M916_9AGAM|nr:hypothetical protein EW146_g289 [Bondarzewia mesenterica]